MSESVICPTCQFQHARRPDGICPRCSARVDLPPAPALAPGAVPLPRGPRIAGAFLLVNALAVMLETVLGGPAAALSGHAPLGAAVHDLVVGSMLVAGNRKVLRWTIFRVCAGAVVFSALNLGRADRLGTVFQLAFSAALLLLLLGTPRRPRIAIATALFSAVMLLEAAGFFQIATGRNPIGSMVMALKGDLERAPEQIIGTRLRWKMTTPAGWYLRPDAKARQDNAHSDRWLVRPDLDAHIMVISEHVDGVASIDPDALARVVLDGARSRDKGLRVIEQLSLPRPGARLLHTVGKASGTEIEFLFGLMTSGADAYQVIGFAPRRNFAEVRPEVEAAIASFVPAPR